MEENKQAHKAFTDEKMQILWDNLDKKEYVDIILLQCYSRCRPQELGQIHMKDAYLTNWTFSGSMKTKAGTGRIVPIHPNIRTIVKKLHALAVMLGSEYLINCVDSNTHTGSLNMTYDKYSHRFKKVINELQLDLEHRPHDPRKHFVTMAKKYNVDEYAIKRIVGHNISDITERIYTERDVDWLIDEINKIE